ncbi:MAG: twin-arginine translocase TatA/TatE family subunit [Acidobacteriota bacterium]
MLGATELVIIFLIIVVLFGSSRLPQLGRGLGEGISNFRRGLKSPDRSIGDGESDQDEGEAKRPDDAA